MPNECAHSEHHVRLHHLVYTEQRGKLLLAVAGKIDDAVAGRAARPFQLVEPVQDRGAQRAGEMTAPRAPVETALAQRPPRLRDVGDVDLQFSSDEFLALAGQRDLVPPAPYALPPRHPVQPLHPEIAGEMIVADPGAAQCRILWPGADAQMADARGQSHQSLQHGRDVGPGETVVAVAAL